MSSIQYQCMTCGGPLLFEASSKKMHCDFCNSRFSIEEVEKYWQEAENAGGPAQTSPPKKTAASTENQQSAETAAGAPTQDAQDAPQVPPTPESSSNLGSKNWENRTETKYLDHAQAGLAQFTCDSCGGDIVGNPDLVSSKCPYCGNVFIVATQLTSTRIPDRMVPFAQSKDAASAGILAASKGLKFLPKAFSAHHVLAEISGIYVPYWLYDAQIFGFYIFEGRNKRSWRQGDFIITETKIYHCRRKGNISFTDVPSSGTSRVTTVETEAIEPYDYTQSVPFDSAYLSGFPTDRYDIDSDQAQNRVIGRMHASTQASFTSTVSGYQSLRILSEKLDMRKAEVEYVFLPMWRLRVKYGGKDYPFAMNGQTGRMVGRFPISYGKMVAWTTGIFFPLATALTLATFAIVQSN